MYSCTVHSRQPTARRTACLQTRAHLEREHLPGPPNRRIACVGGSGCVRIAVCASRLMVVSPSEARRNRQMSLAAGLFIALLGDVHGGCTDGGRGGCSHPVGAKWDRWDMAASTYTCAELSLRSPSALPPALRPDPLARSAPCSVAAVACFPVSPVIIKC